jgi:hypothetical protein
VRAAAAGWVERAENDPTGYGLYVQIRHLTGLTTVYAHLSRLDVRAGTAVQAGQPIGLTGSTGNSTGPHLHFEVRQQGQEQNGYGGAVDPFSLIDWPDTVTPPAPALAIGSASHPGEGQVRVITARLNLRLTPGLDAPIVGSLPAGAILPRAPGDPVALDGADWLPVTLWLAKSFQGQALAEEGSDHAK